MKSTAILIPARYDSKRFPGKPLVDLNGKPMIKRVFDICKSTGLDTYVLTDDMRIFNLFGSRESWIDQTKDFANGTERCAAAATDEAFVKYLGNYDRFINVQGDMPDVTVEMIETTQKQLNRYKVSTVCTMMPEEEQNNPNSVKLVRGNGKCLWFGRGMTGYGDWHLGIYGYQREALESYPNLIGTREERIEQLEQLRWLKNGWDIGVLPVTFSGIEINTPEDAERWNETE
jgi:3-deoxy-manno-octulosonate cytidylyltransferase (CMP-KDO synthetase)